MEYIDQTLVSLLTLAPIAIAQLSQPLLRRRFRRSLYLLAAIFWIAGQILIKSQWLEILISLTGILLFSWLIIGYFKDRQKSTSTKV